MEYRRSRTWCAALAAVWLASSIALAKGTTFDPSLSLGLGYTDEVDYVGQTEQSKSDTTIGLGIDLPVSRELARGFLRARYDLQLRKYENTSALDNGNHRFDLSFEHSTRRDARLGLRTEFVRSVDQLGPPILPFQVVADEPQTVTDDTANLTVTERIERQTFSTSFNYGWRAGGRWRLSTGVGASASKYTRIRDFSGAEPGVDVDDRTGIGATLGARHNSRRMDFGFLYGYQLVQLDTGGDEDFHRLELTLDRDLSRRFRLEFRLGGFQRVPQDPAEKETRITTTLGVGFNDGLIAGPIRIGFGFGVGPSPGGALSGTALNTSAGVNFSAVRVQPWNWRAYLGYNRREPFESGFASTDTGSAGASVERRISKAFGIRFGSSWVDQSSDDPALVGSFLQAGASLAWYPLGGSRIAGR